MTDEPSKTSDSNNPNRAELARRLPAAAKAAAVLPIDVVRYALHELAELKAEADSTYVSFMRSHGGYQTWGMDWFDGKDDRDAAREKLRRLEEAIPNWPTGLGSWQASYEQWRAARG